MELRWTLEMGSIFTSMALCGARLTLAAPRFCCPRHCTPTSSLATWLLPRRSPAAHDSSGGHQRKVNPYQVAGAGGAGGVTTMAPDFWTRA
jgi:hypothetical protein